MGQMGRPLPRGVGGKIRERCTTFEVLRITSVNPTHLSSTRLTSRESSLVDIMVALQFTGTHPLQPLDVTPDGGEVLVTVFGNCDNIFDPNTPNALISREDIVIDVFGSPDWRQ